MKLLSSIRDIYKNGLEVVAWMVLILGFFGGGNLSFGNKFSLNNACIGLLSAFIFNVFVLGPLSVFLEMAEDIKEIKKKINNDSKNETKIIDYPLSTCASCKAKVRQDDVFCQSCGSRLYK